MSENKSLLKTIAQSDDPQLIRSFRGHEDQINSLFFSPDLKQVASGSKDSIVNVWNFKQDTRPFKFTGHKGPVYDVQISPSGLLVASVGEDRTIRLWKNSVQGKCKEIKAHSAAIRSLDFSKDGKFLLTGSDDKTLKIWTVKGGRFQTSLSGHTNWIRSCQFSPDFRLIASGSDDKTARIWDFETKAQVCGYNDHTNRVSTVKFHPDGTCLASGSHDTKIKLRDIRSGRLIQHYDAHEDDVNQIAFHPSGYFLSSVSSDSKIKIWDLRQGRIAYSLLGHQGKALSVTYSEDGDYMATGGSDNIIMVWKTNTAEKFEAGPKRDLLENQATLGLQGKSSFKSNSQNLNASSLLREKTNEMPLAKIDEEGGQFLTEEEDRKRIVAQELAGKIEKVIFQIETLGDTLKRLDLKLSKNEQDVNYLLNNEHVKSWMKVYEEKRKEVASLYEIYKKSEHGKDFNSIDSRKEASSGEGLIRKNIFSDGALANTSSFRESNNN